MDRKPRIGIPVPTTTNLAYSDRSWPEYRDAVEAAGGTVTQIALTLGPKELIEAADVCEGFVLPGSPADLDPQRYGEARGEYTAAPDVDRERTDLALLEHAEATGKPVLGICYGLQSMNVWKGGSLVQQLTPVPVNHEASKQVGVAHTVMVAQASLLGSLLSAAEAPPQAQFRSLGVNSSHHQAVAIPGESLSIVARCPQDGVIEAIEGRVGLAPMLGVQWHPERSVGGSAASRSIFLWLVAEALDATSPDGGASSADPL